MRHILPKLRVPFWPYGVSLWRIDEGRKVLRVGDFLLTISPLGASSMFTPGWDHAAICVAGEKEYFLAIAEMTAKGFGVVTWRMFCRHARRVLICRCDDFTGEYAEKVAAHAVQYRETAYDMQFEVGDKELTCVEMPVNADYAGWLNIKPKTSKLTGQRYYTPQMLLDCPNVSVAWDSAGKLKGKVKR